MANRYPLIIDVTDGNKIKELPSGDTLYLRNNSISEVQDINAVGTINAAMIKVNGNAVSAQEFTDLSDVPDSYAGYENTFVRVNSTGDGLEFRPLTDFGTLQLTSVIVDTNIVPTADVSGSVGTPTQKFNEMHAASFIGDVRSLTGSVIFDATEGTISYSAISNAPESLSEFTNDVGFVTISTVQNEINSKLNNSATLVLAPGTEPDTPVAGMLAVANGTTWAPAGAGVQSLMIYLNGTWTQVS